MTLRDVSDAEHGSVRTLLTEILGEDFRVEGVKLTPPAVYQLRSKPEGGADIRERHYDGTPVGERKAGLETLSMNPPAAMRSGLKIAVSSRYGLLVIGRERDEADEGLKFTWDELCELHRKPKSAIDTVFNLKKTFDANVDHKQQVKAKSYWEEKLISNEPLNTGGWDGDVKI